MRSDTLKDLKQVVTTKVYETCYRLFTTGVVNGKPPLNKLVTYSLTTKRKSICIRSLEDNKWDFKYCFRCYIAV